MLAAHIVPAAVHPSHPDLRRPQPFLLRGRLNGVSLRRLFAWAAWTAAGIIIGFAVAVAALTGVALVLPHCGVQCDDTLPELIAAAAAYGVWMATAVLTSVLAWRHLAGEPGRTRGRA